MEGESAARLHLQEDAFGPEACSVAGGTAVLASLRAPDKDSPNEDAVALLPADGDTAVLVVADGVGGERAGTQASAIAVTSLAAAVQACRGGSGLRAAILDGIERANRAVQELGLGAATTLAAVELADGMARPYHVGDSQVLLVGQRGRVKLETMAHSPVGFAVAAGVLDEEEAMHHEERHVVSNVLGSPAMRIEVGSAVRLASHDTVLVASDGLFDNLHLDEVVARIRAGPIGEAANGLVEAARRRMIDPDPDEPSKPDDLSFVLFRPSGR